MGRGSCARARARTHTRERYHGRSSYAFVEIDLFTVGYLSEGREGALIFHSRRAESEEF